VPWDDLEAEVGRADAVVHLAGEPVASGRWTRERFERIRGSRVVTAARIARAIADAPRKPRVWISGSAIGYYGAVTDPTPVDESAPPGSDPLARVCVEWEGAADAVRSLTRVAHPRIGIVLGRGGGALASMLPAFKLFAGGPIGSGMQWMSWIHMRDVVGAILFALDHEVVEGPFNVTAPEPVTMGTFAAILARALHRPAALRVPGFALRAAMGRGLAEVLLTGRPVVPGKLRSAGFGFAFPALDAALADLVG
jgi:uncharacterized protein (TIGR01777 family)